MLRVPPLLPLPLMPLLPMPLLIARHVCHADFAAFRFSPVADAYATLPHADAMMPLSSLSCCYALMFSVAMLLMLRVAVPYCYAHADISMLLTLIRRCHSAFVAIVTPAHMMRYLLQRYDAMFAAKMPRC